MWHRTHWTSNYNKQWQGQEQPTKHSPVNEIKITSTPQSNCWPNDSRHLLLLCCFCSSCCPRPPPSSFPQALALNMMAVIASQFADWFICYFQFSFKIFPPLLCHNSSGTAVVLLSRAHWKNWLATSFVVGVVDSSGEEVAQNTIWLSNKSHHILYWSRFIAASPFHSVACSHSLSPTPTRVRRVT